LICVLTAVEPCMSQGQKRATDDEAVEAISTRSPSRDLLRSG
jgi:hypothetical protein